MIVYIPQRIETAEQAERLPVGTSVERAVWHLSGHQEYYAGVKVGTNTWFTTSPTADLQDALSRHMVGWTALVPVEAEEEWGVEMSENGEATHVVRATSRENAEWTLGHQQPGTARIVHRTRYITPWEPVNGPDRRGDCA